MIALQSVVTTRVLISKPSPQAGITANVAILITFTQVAKGNPWIFLFVMLHPMMFTVIADSNRLH
jgi:hypothetical protein